MGLAAPWAGLFGRPIATLFTMDRPASHPALHLRLHLYLHFLQSSVDAIDAVGTESGLAGRWRGGPVGP